MYSSLGMQEELRRNEDGGFALGIEGDKAGFYKSQANLQFIQNKLVGYDEPARNARSSMKIPNVKKNVAEA